MNRIVLAYSGSLETSVAIPWLAENYGAEIVAVTMDMGQGKELEAVRDRALAGGAVRAHVLDVRDEFARDFVLPALKADAVYGDRYPMGGALSRALIARKLVEIAAIEQATAIAHGCKARTSHDAGEGLDGAVRAINPIITIFAPARDWGMTRPQAIEYARTRGIPLPATVVGSNSTKMNLWGRSIELEILGDLGTEPPEDIYTLTRPAAECPAEAAYAEMRFEEGTPAAINGVAMPLVELIASLGTIAGAHGVGRSDIVENHLAGITSREVYEAPAAVVLHMAHKELQRFVTTKDAERFSSLVSRQYADIVDKGRWFTPLREALDAYVAKVQERVTGVVRLKLFKGECRVVGRKSPFALYDDALEPSNIGVAFTGAAVGSINMPRVPLPVGQSG